MASKIHIGEWQPTKINMNELFRTIREMIITKGQEVKADNHKFKKWEWLAKEFNNTLQQENFSLEPIVL